MHKLNNLSRTSFLDQPLDGGGEWWSGVRERQMGLFGSFGVTKAVSERKLRTSLTVRQISGVKFIFLVRLGQTVNTNSSVFLSRVCLGIGHKSLILFFNIAYIIT
jgi:hypothetical protein